MKTGKLGAGQVIGVFLVGVAGIAAIFLGFILMAVPETLGAALPAVDGAPTHLPAYLSPTPYQPLPTATPLPPTVTPSPTPTPLPPTATPRPDSARIEGITGYAQSFGLSCESRSAVDWARFFGVEVSEAEFLFALPLSDNPERGFVGFYNDYGGMVPPYSYGVHAEPVAGLLRDYGLPAVAVMELSLEELRAEIAAGRPVIVWIIYGLNNGYAMQYTASDGQTIVVAPNEHTVIVIGYDETSITVLDGAWVYSRNVDQFMRSWEVLGNMAVIYRSEE